MAKRRRPIITTNEFNRPTFKRLDSPEIPVIKLSRNYSESELDELNKLRRRLAKRANSRLLALERAGITYGAYEKAKVYLSQVVEPGRKLLFREAKRLPLADTRQQLYEIERFLNMQTSTPGGAHKFQRAAFRESLEKYSLSRKLTEEAYYDFVSSAPFQLAKKYVDSDELIEFLDNAYSEGNSMEDIISAVEAMNRNEIGDIQSLYNRVGLDYFDYLGKK